MNLAYLRSESTAASSGGDAAFPLIDDHLALTLGGAFDEASFVSADPPTTPSPYLCPPPKTTNCEKLRSFEQFETPPGIRTLLDEVDWSIDAEADFSLCHYDNGDHGQFVSTASNRTDSGRRFDDPDFLSATAGAIKTLLERPGAIPSLQRLLNVMGESGEKGQEDIIKSIINLALVCHLTGQLSNSAVSPSSDIAAVDDSSPTKTCGGDHSRQTLANEAIMLDEVEARHLRPPSGSMYVFPPPPPMTPPSAPLVGGLSGSSAKVLPSPPNNVKPVSAPSGPMESNIERIFDSLKASLNETLSQLMAPVMNGFFQQSLPSISRWRNIDVTFPILLPTGHLCVSNDQDIQKMEVLYSFEDPDLQSVFGSPVLELFSAGDPAQGGLTPASLLRTRVAVIHKCPDFLVSKMSQLFHELISSQCPVLDEPITLSCTRVSRCSVPYSRQSNGSQSGDRVDCHERIEALVSPATPQDEKRLLKVSSLLWTLADVINTRLANVVSSFYSRLPQSLLHKRSVPEDLYNSATRKVGLEFRFAPSKQMKIVLAQRSLHQPSSLLVKRVDVSGIQLCEIRLEQDRCLDKEWDPLLLQQGSVYVPTKRILRDEAGNCVGRAVLVSSDKINLPRVYKMSSPSSL